MSGFFLRLLCLVGVMEWMGMDDGMDPTEWGWDLQGNQLVPLMMENSPAPDPPPQNDPMQLFCQDVVH